MCVVTMAMGSDRNKWRGMVVDWNVNSYGRMRVYETESVNVSGAHYNRQERIRNGRARDFVTDPHTHENYFSFP